MIVISVACSLPAFAHLHLQNVLQFADGPIRYTRRWMLHYADVIRLRY